MANFDKAFDPIFKREGGSKITNDPNDAGRLTKYGISQRSYPDEDIRNLTLDRAKFLYRRDFWNKVGGDGIRNQRSGLSGIIKNRLVRSTKARKR